VIGIAGGFLYVKLFSLKIRNSSANCIMKRSENLWLYIIMIIAMASWGLSWTNGKILGNYTSVSMLMFWRFGIAALAMVPILLYAGVSIRLTPRSAAGIFASSILLMLYNYFYFTGTHVGKAGAGGVLVTTLNPVATFILVSAMERIRIQRRPLIGILMGILGGTIIINLWGRGMEAIFVHGNQYFLLCASTWAVLTLISSRIGKHIHILAYSFWLYLISAAFSFLFIDKSKVFAVFDLNLSFWLNLLSISVGAMAFATTAYFIAASRLGSSKAAAFTFTVPVSAMLFSMLILKESLQLNVVFGGLFSIAAVVLINSQGKKGARPS